MSTASLLELAKVFAITSRDLVKIAAAFQKDMESGLACQHRSLKMLPSYLTKPGGEETGLFVALDFGGTNIRAQVVELAGRRWEIKQQRVQLLKDAAAMYDYTSTTTKAEALFDFIAAAIAAVVEPGRDYFLGHTFSFPCQQQSFNQAMLLSWTKEISTTGVEGEDVNQLLTAALLRRGLDKVTPCVILNDTVGTLMAGAYLDARASIGTICGTGHNTCYYDPSAYGAPMIINIESGNFNGVPCTRYDSQLDAASDKPGSQLLEKMVAGRYLGEIVRLAANDAIGLTLPPLSFTAERLAAVLSGAFDGILTELELTKKQQLAEISRLVVERSARLAAATYAGVLRHIDSEVRREHIIAVDGSLFEKMPGYSAAMNRALGEVLGSKSHQVKVSLTKDGSGAGAAIAAAAILKKQRCRP